MAAYRRHVGAQGMWHTRSRGACWQANETRGLGGAAAADLRLKSTPRDTGRSPGRVVAFAVEALTWGLGGIVDAGRLVL